MNNNKIPSHVLLSTTITLLLLLSSATVDNVLDVDGNPLVPGIKYYILPATQNYGGLSLKPRKNTNTCPFYVSFEKNKASLGHAVTFTPKNEQDSEITTSSPLQIISQADYGRCELTKWWRLVADSANDGSGRLLVVTGGPQSDWFRMRSAGNGVYKIVYCPDDSNSIGNLVKDDVVCADLGVFNKVDGDVEKWFLGMRSEKWVLLVKFKKVDEPQIL
ncbi:kunitz-type serine protease inhibitor DrTI-like [Silene latifolia]|uniref:kunitz-type serine protease inhibitor DrTI-like n=1 Tax=Silene latifolia TaxID=37657 RepID=UPI003D76B88D